jgi:hypothetical protein
VNLAKYLGYSKAEANSNKTFRLTDLSLESLHLKDLQYYWISATVVSYGAYFTIGGFLHVSCEFILVKYCAIMEARGSVVG